MKEAGILALALAGCAAVASGRSQAASIPRVDAASIFASAHALCEAEAGRLWGVSLCVPMMVADANTHQAMTKIAVRGSTRDGDLFRLTLPPAAEISTAPVEYDGISWAQIMWPLVGSADFRAVLLMHESFHIVQPKLGFTGYAGTGSISGDASLDTQAGRIWLRGELHALRAALETNGEARTRALHDALAMRLYRASLFAGTAEQEREQDIMEGLAEGTGIDAGLPPGHRIAYALRDMAFVEAQPSYARSFAYATGPAYSEILDAAKPRWRRGVTPASDITHLAMRAYGLSVAVPTASQAQAIILRYGGAEIESQEEARAARKTAQDAMYTHDLVSGPTITLPMTHFKITFNPRDIETLAQYGSVYHTLNVSAPWGTIVVSGGAALISKNFHVLRVAAPADARGNIVQGQGWTLNVAPGYAIVPDPKKIGSFVVSGQH